MNLAFFIGKRYVAATRGKGFVSFISVISVLGIAVGIMALIVVMAVMNGVSTDVRDRLLSMTAHIKIISVSGQRLSKDESIQSLLNAYKRTGVKSRVVAFAPYISGQALISMGQDFNGVQIKGIEPQKEATISTALADIKPAIETLQAGSFHVLIGRNLADFLGVGVGDKITLIVPKATVSAAGLVPRIKRVTVSGIFYLDYYTYDSQLLLMNIEDAGKLFQRGNTIDGYQLRVDDLFAAPRIAKDLNALLPYSQRAFDWTVENKSYFDAVKVEKGALFFVLMMIVVVAAFNILSTLVMVVTDKRRDIAILRTVGASPGMILQTFIIQGMILGVAGTIIGVMGGILLAHQIPNMMSFLDVHFGIRLPAQLYFISSINPLVDTTVVVWICIFSLLLSFLSTLYPAYRASRLQPARALAYE